MTDLWPTDFGTVTTRSPLTILKEQAALLGSKTKNIVKASVHKVPMADSSFYYEFVVKRQRSTTTDSVFLRSFITLISIP